MIGGMARLGHAMTAFEDRPTAEFCPKCDRRIVDDWTVRFHEWLHDYPKFEGSHLDWSCPHCGYSVSTACADAKEAVPV